MYAHFEGSGVPLHQQLVNHVSVRDQVDRAIKAIGDGRLVRIEAKEVNHRGEDVFGV